MASPYRPWRYAPRDQVLEYQQKRFENNALVESERRQAAPSYAPPRDPFARHGDAFDARVGGSSGNDPLASAPKQGRSLFGKLKDLSGDVLGKAEDIGAGTLHAGLKAASYPFEKSAKYGSPLFAMATGETRAGRHEILDANGQGTGQYYRDKPDFLDQFKSLTGTLTHPIREYQKGMGAVQERTQAPEMQKGLSGVVGRTALRTFSDPLQVGLMAGTGGASAGANVGINAASEGLNQYGDQIGRAHV